MTSAPQNAKSRTKNRTGIFLLIFTILSLLGAVASLAPDALAYFERMKISEDFNQIAEQDLVEGQIVTGTIEIAVDWFAEEYEGYGVAAKTVYRYYLIPVYYDPDDSRSEVSHFIVYRAPTSRVEAMDTLVERSWSGKDDKTRIKVSQGVLSKLDSRIRRYLDDYVTGPGFYEGGSFVDWCAQNRILGSSDKAFIESRILQFEIQQIGFLGDISLLTIALAGFVLLGLLLFVADRLIHRHLDEIGYLDD